MAIRKIIELGDEVLRKKSFPVTDFSEKTHQLLDDMKDTLKKAEGAGLAAVQVGVLRRMFVCDVKEGYFEFINPDIIETKGKRKDIEGCLSIPKKHGFVIRPKYVKVKAQDGNGNFFEIEAEDFFAKCICHEYDHLDGIVYTDKAVKVFDEKD